LQSAGTTAITVDTSQNVGIGVTPSAWQATFRGFQVGSGASISSFSTAEVSLTTNAYYGGSQWKYINTDVALRYTQNGSGHQWAYVASGTAGNTISFTNAMTLDSSGNLLVGTTNSNSNSFKLKVQAGTDVCVGLASATSISGALTFNFINDANSANVPVDFRCNGFYISNGLATGAGTNAVKFNTTTKQLTYDTSSARYKNNIRDSIYGLDHVMQMRSAQFEYKDTGNSDVGLIAEEMQPIIPELVGLNEEGLADSVSYDRMVSVLVKAIQELKSINDTQAETINALTARIVALETA
jgi:hypothetical protein